MKLSWPGRQKRALLIRANGAEAYTLRRGAITLEAAFALDELELFEGYCQSRRDSLFVLLADLVEEDFQLETIPYVVGPTRRQLLARKFEQLYRNMPYRACSSLGREKNPAPDSRRRDELVLFMALTNSQALNPWLEVMHATRNQVRGVYSLAVASSWLGAHFDLAGRGVLAVTLNRAGLRQVYLEGGQPRFARLAAFDVQDMTGAGTRIATEIARTQQYLATLRWLRRDAGPLPVVLVCPPGVRASWRAACVNTDRLEFEFTDLAMLAAPRNKSGLGGLSESSSDNLYADSLWAAGALNALPKINFAPAWAGEHYALWRWRAAITATGAATCAVGIAAGAVLFGQAKTIDFQADRHMADMGRANLQYQQVAKSFPQTLTTPEHLKNAVLALDPWVIRPLTPEPILIQISQALTQAPAFALEKIEWLSTANPDSPSGSGAAARATPAPRAAGSIATAVERYEVVILTGALSQERAATPRRKVAAARTAIDALRRIPGVEVTPVRLPMDVSPSGVLKGGDEETAAADAAEPIVLRLTRKAPS